MKKILIAAILIIAAGAFLLLQNAPTEERPLNVTLFWACGSTHNHVMVSELVTSRREGLERTVNASKQLGLKFIVLSEKGATFDDPALGGWEEMVTECDGVTNSEFVCFPGQEICTPNGSASPEPKGHFVIIDNREYIPNINISDIFDEAHSQGALAIIAHPLYKLDETGYRYERWDITTYDGVEILDGAIYDEANEAALEKAYEIWNNGSKKSVTGSADFKNIKYLEDNKTKPLSIGEIKEKLAKGYTCVYVSELNRTAIKDAIKAGHGYVSSGAAINEFTVNGVMMGEKIEVSSGEMLLIKINVSADGNIKKMALIKNGEVENMFEPAKPELIKEIQTTAQESAWYGLEVYSEGGNAFANAIWVDVE